MTGDDGKPSKTQRKKAVHALQDLGEALVGLREEQLARIELPERLRDAIEAARRIAGFEAKRRQLQYIGKLMRGVEAGPIRAALDAVLAPPRAEAAAHKRVEGWRERLLADPGALDELAAEYPRADVRRLRALARAALRERAEARPPRAFRELYQALRAVLARDER
ncbi:MAG TPA: ribosome biogenesis factor YjgA [Burkholderiales bacterium]